MALTLGFIEDHIRRWEEQLQQSPFYPHRTKWPSRLFHHTPVENAAEVLRRSALLSRNQSTDARLLDIADPGVLSNRQEAHDFARLYFRPRTPTQFWIEGVRRPTEYYKGEKHAPTLVMLVFDAKAVLRLPGVRFSNSNMQSPSTIDGDTEEFFSTIDFERVFHEGPFSNDPHVIPRRCAEVLAPSPLQLEGTLQFVYCRSQAERAFLLHRLGAHAATWQQRIRVSDDIRVFEKRFAFVEHVSIARDGLIFELAPRFDGADINLAVSVFPSGSTTSILSFGPDMLRTTNPHGGKRWRVPGEVRAGEYRVRIMLEGCLVYEANLVLGDMPF